MTQDVSSSVAPRFPLIYDKATLTIEVSINSMMAAAITVISKMFRFTPVAVLGSGPRKPARARKDITGRSFRYHRPGPRNCPLPGPSPGLLPLPKGGFHYGLRSPRRTPYRPREAGHRIPGYRSFGPRCAAGTANRNGGPPC